MARFDAACKQALQDSTIPHLAVLARNGSGSFNYAKYFNQDSPVGRPISPSTTFTLASMTKLPTSVALLQLVEKGLIGLDDDVTLYLPILGRQRILCGFGENGESVLQTRMNPITSRQLLTHSAGLGYDFSDKLLFDFQAQRGRAVASGATVETRFDLPLLYEPGHSWNYSCAIDWVGKLVEELTHTTLEDYMLENIWKPLGVEGFTFWPKENEAIKTSFVTLYERDLSDEKLKELPHGLPLNLGVEDCLGGQGGYSTATTFMELLHSILLNDERLLSKAMVEIMFEPQLSDLSQGALQEKMSNLAWAIGDFDPSDSFNWGLGGILVSKSQHGARGPSTMIWSGAPNLFWFIDKAKGVCGCFATQVLPPSDPRIAPLIVDFQRDVYSQLQKQE